MDGYGKFAEYYDMLTSNIPYFSRGEYFHEILMKNSINEGILVDLACGTGTLTQIMADFNYDVIGVDGSAEMLSIALNKRYESGKNILYLNQEMQDLDLYGTIDACICALDSINHITNSKTVQQVFDKVSLFLNPNGIFIFDVNTQYKHEKILSDNVFVYDLDEVYCVWQNSKCENETIEISLDLFCKNQGSANCYTKQTEYFSEKAYSHDEILYFIKKAGLNLVDYYEADTFNKPSKECQRVVYVTKKPELQAAE